MRILISYALAICASAAILAGCGGGSLSQGLGPTAMGAGTGSHLPVGHQLGEHPIPYMGLRTPVVHRDLHKSWISPAILSGKKRRLWVSDFGTNDVYVYAMPSMALLATLTGFNGPQGMCSDNAGHVWIANTYSFDILEYSRNGTLINTLNDPNGWPVSCAWQRNGDVAVTNIVNFVSGSQVPGGVEIYHSGTGSPTLYQGPNIFYYYSDGYDSSGNLFVDGTGGYPYYSFAFGELPQSGSSISPINITGGTIYSPGGVQWNTGENAVDVGDQECGGNPLADTSCVNAVSVSGSTGSIIGTTALNNQQGTPSCDIVQTVRMSDFLYGGDTELPNEAPYFACASGGSPTIFSAEYRWLYPAGGNPDRSSTNSMSEPDGVAISK